MNSEIILSDESQKEYELYMSKKFKNIEIIKLKSTFILFKPSFLEQLDLVICIDENKGKIFKIKRLKNQSIRGYLKYLKNLTSGRYVYTLINKNNQAYILNKHVNFKLISAKIKEHNFKKIITGIWKSSYSFPSPLKDHNFGKFKKVPLKVEVDDNHNVGISTLKGEIVLSTTIQEILKE